MPLNKVIIIPEFGWFGDKPSDYTQGGSYLRLLEVDVIDQYVRCMKDELETMSRHVEVLDTRTRPGKSEKDRITAMEDTALTVYAGAGFHKGKNVLARNVAKVFYGSPLSWEIAMAFKETMDEWGRRSYFHFHSTKTFDSETANLNFAKCQSIRIEPFCINACGSMDLAVHLDALGKDLGRLVAEYVKRT